MNQDAQIQVPSKTGHLQTWLWPGKPSLRTKAKCLTGASPRSGGKKLGKFIIFQRKGTYYDETKKISVS